MVGEVHPLGMVGEVHLVCTPPGYGGRDTPWYVHHPGYGRYTPPGMYSSLYTLGTPLHIHDAPQCVLGVSAARGVSEKRPWAQPWD